MMTDKDEIDKRDNKKHTDNQRKKEGKKFLIIVMGFGVVFVIIGAITMLNAVLDDLPFP